MTLYYWRGVHRSGRSVRGQLHAVDRSRAASQLQERGVGRAWLLPLPEQLLPVSSTQITLLIRQLSTLLSSGLTLARALEGIIQGLDDSPLRRLATEILLELRQGSPFSDVVARRPNLFDPFLIHLIRSGERSGALSTLLARGADYRERSRALRRQVWRALSYPLGVLLFTLLISLFLLLQVVPQFELLFHNLGGELPPLTRQILATAHFLEENMGQLILLLSLFVLSIALSLRLSRRLRWGSDRLLLSLPLIGDTLIEVMVARLSRTVATLQSAGVPLHTGLAASEQMTRNLPLATAIHQTHQAVLEGESLSQAISRQGLFPPVAVQMVLAGEESGQLDQLLERLAAYYEERVEHRIQQLTTLLEPLLILLIGGMVAVLAIALYQPVFQIGHQL